MGSYIGGLEVRIGYRKGGGLERSLSEQGAKGDRKGMKIRQVIRNCGTKATGGW